MSNNIQHEAVFPPAVHNLRRMAYPSPTRNGAKGSYELYEPQQKAQESPELKKLNTAVETAPGSPSSYQDYSKVSSGHSNQHAVCWLFVMFLTVDMLSRLPMFSDQVIDSQTLVVTLQEGVLLFIQPAHGLNPLHWHVSIVKPITHSLLATLHYTCSSFYKMQNYP